MRPFISFLILSAFLSCSKDSDSTTEKPISQPKKFTLTVAKSPSDGGSVSPSSGTYEEGTIVTLEGTPSNGYLFKEWSGDAQGTKNPISITMDLNKSITGVFEVDCEALKYPLIDFKQASYYTDILFHPKGINDTLIKYDDLEGGYDYGSGKASFDYNLDGYLDFVSFRFGVNPETGEYRNPIRFFKGNCNGEVVYDDINSEKFMGMDAGRKIIFGDYNNDGYPDIFLIGHGLDQPPFPGEYPVVLMSDGNGGFTENRLTQFVSFYHGGSSGDYDMDGDLDVVLVTGWSGTYLFLENDGFGNFIDKTSTLPLENQLIDAKYSTEFYDFNGDGDLELFMFGGEGGSFSTFVPTIFIEGNGVDFSGEIRVLPEVPLWELVLDIAFYDIDANGTKEIILNRTKPNYQGWYIQIVEEIDGAFVDSTEKFIQNYFNETQNWNVWIYVGDFERNGTIELRNSSNPSVNHQNYLRWELMGDMFIRRN